MKKNIWDNSMPVEKSAYLNDDKVQFFNIENFETNPEKLKMIDLFCGAGGFAVGCSWAGFESVFGVDHLEPAMRTWIYNHPHAIGCLGDIKQVYPEDIKKILMSKGIEKIHLITGGVPCQGFSRANRKHNDFDERNFLFLEYMRFVKVFDPDYLILENVSGMRSTAGGQFEQDIKEYMETLGYDTSVDILNAADFGVPQVRQRLIFVGVKKNRGLTTPFVFPKGSFKGNYRTVREAISDLPELGNNESSVEYSRPPQNEYQKFMREDVGDRLYNHSSPRHPQDTIEKIRNTKQGAPMYPKFQQRIRLCEDKPSPTQLAGGIRPQFQFGHPTQPRGLSIRERARIQSFPDNYVFLGGTVQERVQTGNAVPPLLIYNIAKLIATDIEKGRKKNV